MKNRQLEDLAEKHRKSGSKTASAGQADQANVAADDATQAGTAAAKKVVDAFKKALAHTH